MPRTSRVELPGCPRFRAICCDSLGLIKVVEVEGQSGAPKVVARWGDPDPRQGILCQSLSSDAIPTLAVVRKTQTVEIRDPASGALQSELSVPRESSDSPGRATREASNEVCGLHLFRKGSSWGPALLTCTRYGDAALQRLSNLGGEELRIDQSNTEDSLILKWNVSQTGSVLCMDVDGREEHAVFGGKDVDINIWDIAKKSKIWSAKAPHRDNLGLISPAWVTAISFLRKEDRRKIVVGTGHHQIRLYDIGAQRRPVIAFDYGESPIKTIAEDPDGHSVYVGTGSGELALFDMRTGKLVGGFKGKCSGSIRSVVRHAVLPIIASCGLDRYLRIHCARTRQLLGSLYLKQQLVSVVFDVSENMPTQASSVKSDSYAAQDTAAEHTDDEDDVIPEVGINRPRLSGKKVKIVEKKPAHEVDVNINLTKDRPALQDKILKLKRTVAENKTSKSIRKRKIEA